MVNSRCGRSMIKICRVSFRTRTNAVEGLGERFVTRIEAAAARVLTNPLMPRCFDGECRKVKTDKFPDLIIYREKNEPLQILAIAHPSRRPRYWRADNLADFTELSLGFVEDDGDGSGEIEGTGGVGFHGNPDGAVVEPFLGKSFGFLAEDEEVVFLEFDLPG